MKSRHVSADDLLGKVTDIHSHAGVGLGAYVKGAYPYCQNIESLYYQQQAGGVDFNVVFPYSADLHFDLVQLREGVCAPAERPMSQVPYELENRLLLKEVFTYCPELSDRFLPFVCADPARSVEGQVDVLRELAEDYPVYGIKIVPVSVQSPLAALLGPGQPILEFAVERDLPFLFHVTTHRDETWSDPTVALALAERYPPLRFCLAHCVGLHRGLLTQADDMSNVWVDTSALKVQVQLAHENSPVMAAPEERFDWDYSDHCQIMRELMACFPDTIVWGTDSPAYAYICDRRDATGKFVEFRLKGRYEDEIAALNALSSELRAKACSGNAAAFLFGSEPQS